MPTLQQKGDFNYDGSSRHSRTISPSKRSPSKRTTSPLKSTHSMPLIPRQESATLKDRGATTPLKDRGSTTPLKDRGSTTPLKDRAPSRSRRSSRSTHRDRSSSRHTSRSSPSKSSRHNRERSSSRHTRHKSPSKSRHNRDRSSSRHTSPSKSSHPNTPASSTSRKKIVAPMTVATNDESQQSSNITFGTSKSGSNSKNKNNGKPSKTVVRDINNNALTHSDSIRKAINKHTDVFKHSVNVQKEVLEIDKNSPQQVKWLQLKQPASTITHVMDVGISTIPRLERGIPVTKVTSRGQLAPRYLTISKDKLAIFITHHPIIQQHNDTNDNNNSTDKIKQHNGKNDDPTGAFSNVATMLPIPVFSRKGLKGIKSEQTLRSKYMRWLDVCDIDSVQVGMVGTQKLENARTHLTTKRTIISHAQSLLSRTSSGNSTNTNTPGSTTHKSLSNASTNASSHHDRSSNSSIAPSPGGSGGHISASRVATCPLVVNERQIVSIIHHGNQTLDMLIEDDADREDFCNTVDRMRRVYHQAKKWVGNEALLMRYLWNEMDTNRDGFVEIGEFVKMLQQINFYHPNPEKVYHNYVTKMKKTRKAGMTYVDVMKLLQLLKKSGNNCMADIIWDEYFGEDTELVGPDVFLTKWLHGKQKQKNMTKQDVTELFIVLNSMEINHCEGDPDHTHPERLLSRARFEIYLYDLMNSAYHPRTLDQAHALTLNKPLSAYWINTSHNTYLTGDQLRSESSVEMYSQALRRGCKCLEIDCWDGDQSPVDGSYQPVVYHGHTLTSKIFFRDVLKCIRSYIDDYPRTYPIILSLENHCSPSYQLEMAKQISDIFGDRVYIPTEDDVSHCLPSPETLRGRVVVKGKRPPHDSSSIGNDDSSSSSSDSDDSDPYEGQHSNDNIPPPPPDMGTPASSQSALRKKKAKVPKIVKALAEMTLFHGTKYNSFDKSIVAPHSHMHSIGENKIIKIISKHNSHTKLWRKYNVNHLTRTYPAGVRVDSSNYNPVLAWSLGCQLVALNFQTWDSAMVLNDGLFRRDQMCGYIEKPKGVLGSRGHKVDGEVSESSESDHANGDASRSKSHEYDVTPAHITNVPLYNDWSELLNTSLMTSKNKCCTIIVKVLSATCLPKPNGEKTGEHIDPYILVTLHDVKVGRDGKAFAQDSQESTEVIKNNGFCPKWDDANSFKFTLYSLDVAMLQFSVRDADITRDDKVAEAAIPISCLRQGIRSVQLFDRNNTRTGFFGFASLLVDIEFTAMRDLEDFMLSV